MIAPVRGASMEAVVDALRAVRDAKTNTGGLKAFRKRLQHGGAGFLEEYLRASPAFEELHRIWDHQQTVGHPRGLPPAGRVHAAACPHAGLGAKGSRCFHSTP